MFKRLFSRKAKAAYDFTDGVYGQIVAGARQPHFFSHWAVPDTPLGRFEMIGLHMFLFLRRLRLSGGALEELGQQVTDIFFTEVDHSLRELGIGDSSVPKRMKKLARMYFGRLESYDSAITAGDMDTLAQALKRNIRPDAAEWPQAASLATYVLAAEKALSAQDDATLLAGIVRFPDPATLEPDHAS